MDAKGLINIASQFIASENGKKLFEKVKGVDFDNVTEALAAQQNKTKNDYSELSEDQKEQKGKKLAKYTPYFAIYTTKGVVYDKRTKEPIQGIEVRPQLVLYPIIKEARTNPITKEVLTDDNGNILYGAKKGEDKKFPVTDKDGQWELKFAVPYVDALRRIVYPPTYAPIVYYKDVAKGPQTPSQRDAGTKGDDYAPGIQYITTLDGEVPQDQPAYSLFNINDAAEVAKSKLIFQINKIGNDLTEKALEPVERTLTSLRSMVMAPTKVVQTKLLPLAIQLMLLFGITSRLQAEQKLQKCPNSEALADAIAKRNSIVRQLNNIYKIIITNTALAALFLFLSKYLIGIKNLIASIPFPLSVPPGLGVPYALVSKLEGVQDLLEDIAGINKDLKKNLIISLIFLIVSLIIILLHLKTLDNLIGECVGDTNEDFVPLNNELIALQEKSTLQGIPELKIVNGFVMSVEVVDKAQVGDLPRRQAIAKNSKGITILKGEASFAAENQVLINELAFYIQQNDLKAD